MTDITPIGPGEIPKPPKPLGSTKAEGTEGQRADRMHVDKGVAEQLALSVTPVDAHQPRLQPALRELLDGRGLMVGQKDRLVLDVVGIGKRQLERLAATEEDLRLGRSTDRAEDEQRE